MERKPRALIAVQPAALPLLEQMLGDVLDMVPVHTIAEAQAALERERGRIELIVSSLTFSESRALEFLVAVKSDPHAQAIAFLCCRVLVGILSENLVASLGRAAKLCGAADFVDIGQLPRDQAREALRAAVARCLAASP